MALRCVYTDLDGTLLGAGASLFRDGEGGFTLLPARALEMCHRAGVEVVLKSGRRKEQVAEDARIIGQRSYIYEVGAGLVIEGEEQFLCGPFGPRDGESPHAQIAATGAPDLLLREFDGALEDHSPWHTGRFVSHVMRGSIDAAQANDVLAREGHTDLKLIDNGDIPDGRRVFHLIPAAASKRGAVELHMRARGYAPEECIAVGDSAEDASVAGAVGRFFLVANAGEIRGAGLERTEASHGDGFYEAVTRTLAEAR